MHGSQAAPERIYSQPLRKTLRSVQKAGYRFFRERPTIGVDDSYARALPQNDIDFAVGWTAGDHSAWCSNSPIRLPQGSSNTAKVPTPGTAVVGTATLAPACTARSSRACTSGTPT